MNRLFYFIHKWVSAAAYIQLAIWTTTGFLFATLSQDAMKSAPVEGAHRGVIAAAPPISVASALATVGTTVGEITKVELRGTAIGPFYVVTGDKGSARVDARTGVSAPVTQAEAEAAARRDQPNSPAVAQSALISEAPPIEYRDGPLPTWRVSLADAAGTVVYVDATTGEVAQRHNDRWRLYDILWMLHVMDYKGRENFNNPLMVCAASLAVLTAYSGIVILLIKVWRWGRRKRRVPANGLRQAA